ncbi:hypothetical protein NMY22_g14473 [Coprinellus aureogranulatus]|nr:hypothetical protein NMY22_g14473 [Coprinellus aureogranulatus]
MSIYVQADRVNELVGTARLVNGWIASGITLLLVEYFHTLPTEVEFIWPTRTSIPKLLFLVTRYGNFVFAFITIIYTLSPLPSTDACKHLGVVILVLEVSMALIGEAVMYHRVWAFSGRRIRVRNILLTVYLNLNDTPISQVLAVPWLVSSRYLDVAWSIGYWVPIPPTQSTLGRLASSLGGTRWRTYRELPHQVKYLAKSRVITLDLWGYLHDNVWRSCVCFAPARRPHFVAGMTAAIGSARYKLSAVSRPGRFRLVQEFYQGGLSYLLVLIRAYRAVIINHSMDGKFAHAAINLRHPFVYRFNELQIIIHGIIVTRVILQLREFSKKNQVVALGAASGVRGHTAVIDLSLTEIRRGAPMVTEYAD